MPPKRMTAHPIRPGRYRPGKRLIGEQSSSEEEDDEEQEEEEDKAAIQQAQAKKKEQIAKAKRAQNDSAKVNNSQQARSDAIEARIRRAEEQAEREHIEREAGFVTESESEEDQPVTAAQNPQPTQSRVTDLTAADFEDAAPIAQEESSDGYDSEADSSDSSKTPPEPIVRPIFVPKSQRKKNTNFDHNHLVQSSADLSMAEAARKQEELDALLQEKIDRDIVARAAGKRDWDDEDPGEGEIPDDTDDVNPELEHAQWVARELARLQRRRTAMKQHEDELAELERRRDMTQEERDVEDREKIEEQERERDDKGQMSHMQRYHHRGAFFLGDNMDEEEAQRYKELASRNIMGATFEDQEMGKEGLPEYLQTRDPSKIGRKGRTKYKDMKSEDTGSWGGGDLAPDPVEDEIMA